MRLPFLFSFCLLACGGATNEPTETPGGASTVTTPPESPTKAPAANDSPKTAPDTDCPSPASVIAKSGTTIRQPVGSAQRFQLVYQGSALGVSALRGVDMIVGGSDGPFKPGTSSGFWAEVRDGSGKTTFTRLLMDPTRQEAPAGNGGFTNSTIDKCIAKTILVDVPRSPSGSVLVVFGSPYGQPTAGELGRFTLE